jgi:hypothetical protein
MKLDLGRGRDNACGVHCDKTRRRLSMDPKTLITKLRELRTQLAATKNADPQTLSLLEEVSADLDRLHDESQPTTRADVDSVSGRVQNLLTRFEAEHPRLTSVLQQVLDGLANLGI